MRPTRRDTLLLRKALLGGALGDTYGRDYHRLPEHARDQIDAYVEMIVEEFEAELTKHRQPMVCAHCKGAIHIDDDYYMVHDKVWRQAMPTYKGHLHVSCLERRLGRFLTIEDFTGFFVNAKILLGARLASPSMPMGKAFMVLEKPSIDDLVSALGGKDKIEQDVLGVIAEEAVKDLHKEIDKDIIGQMTSAVSPGHTPMGKEQRKQFDIVREAERRLAAWRALDKAVPGLIDRLIERSPRPPAAWTPYSRRRNWRRDASGWDSFARGTEMLSAKMGLLDHATITPKYVGWLALLQSKDPVDRNVVMRAAQRLGEESGIIKLPPREAAAGLAVRVARQPPLPQSAKGVEQRRKAALI